MSKLRTLAAASLLIALPLISMQASAGDSIIKSQGGELAINVDPDNIDSKDVRLDADYWVHVRLPLDMDIGMEFRYEDSVDALGDLTDEESAYYKEVVKQLNLGGHLYVDYRVGKLDADYGATGTGIGESGKLRQRDALQNRVSQRSEAVMGIKISTGADIADADREVLNAIFSNISVTAYNMDSNDDLDFSDFKNINAVSIRKTGSIAGVKTQGSMVYGDSDDTGKQERYSISAEKEFGAAAVYGEYQYYRKGPAADAGTKSTTSLGASYEGGPGNLKYSANYTMADQAGDPDYSDPATIGDELGFNAKKYWGKNESWSAGAEVTRDLDREDNTYFLRIDKSFGRK